MAAPIDDLSGESIEGCGLYCRHLTVLLYYRLSDVLAQSAFEDLLSRNAQSRVARWVCCYNEKQTSFRAALRKSMRVGRFDLKLCDATTENIVQNSCTRETGSLRRLLSIAW